MRQAGDQGPGPHGSGFSCLGKAPVLCTGILGASDFSCPSALALSPLLVNEAQMACGPQAAVCL